LQSLLNSTSADRARCSLPSIISAGQHRSRHPSPLPSLDTVRHCYPPSRPLLLMFEQRIRNMAYYHIQVTTSTNRQASRSLSSMVNAAKGAHENSGAHVFRSVGPDRHALEQKLAPHIPSVELLLHPKTMRHGTSCASKRAVKVARGDRQQCKTHASERVKTRHHCKLQGQRAVARVRHALSFCAMPCRLDM
jgi:hypothetical protein